MAEDVRLSFVAESGQYVALFGHLAVVIVDGARPPATLLQRPCSLRRKNSLEWLSCDTDDVFLAVRFWLLSSNKRKVAYRVFVVVR